MKKINKDNIKLYSILLLMLLVIALVVYAVLYATKNYNRGDIMTLENFSAKYTINKDQLDAINMPNPNLTLSYNELPKTKNTIDEIDIKTLNRLFQTTKKSILVLVKDDCSYCEDYLPKLEESLNSYQISAYKININNLSDSEFKNIYNYIDFDGTPTTYIIDNGKAIHTLSGTVDEETLNAFIDYFYIRNN